MKEIEEAKQDMSDNVPGPNQRAAEEEASGDEEEEGRVEERRSGRERKPVSYVVEGDLDGRKERKKDWCWKDRGNKEESNHHLHESQTLFSESHSLLPR
jgi:hypothetical protein